MRLHSLFASALIVGLLAACGGGNPTTTIRTSAGNIEVELLDEGQTPHGHLRYDLKEGVSESLEMQIETKMLARVDGKEMPEASAPPVGMVMDFRPFTKTKDGHLRADFTLEEIFLVDDGGLDDKAAEKLESGFESLLGVGGWIELTPFGQAVDGGVNLNSRTPPEVRDAMGSLTASFKQMPMAFPEQEIGVGAKWKVTMPAQLFGLYLTQEITYVLVKFDGHEGTLDVSFRQTATGQLQGPSLPPNAVVEVESMESRGHGTLDFHLGHFVPQADVDLDMKLKAKMTVGSESHAMEQEAAMKLNTRRLQSNE